MQLKKIFVASLLMLLPSMASWAQIHISPYIPEKMTEGFNANTATLLKSRLHTILSQNGITSHQGTSRFVIAGKIALVDKSALATIPTKIVSKINLHLGIGDGIDGICYKSTDFELTGVGTTDNQAITNAISKINGNLKGMKEFIQSANEQIIEFYKKNADNLLLSAETLMKRSKYEEAVAILSQIPQEAAAYKKAQEMLIKATQKQINQEADKLLTEAQASWAADASTENKKNIVALLSQIEPDSKSYPEVKKFIEKMEKQALDDKEYEKKLNEKEMDHEKEMEIAKMKYAESIANTYLQNQPKVVYKDDSIAKW